MPSIEEAILFLKDEYCIVPSGVVHVGANVGQERDVYKHAGLRHGIFVEPIPEVFSRLSANLANDPYFRPINAVCAAEAGQNIRFNIASNEESSSMLPLGRHGTLFPDIRYDRAIDLISTTVDNVVAANGADLDLDMLVVDVQGAEAEVLNGATTFTGRCKSLFLEVSEEPLYEGGCSLDDLVALLRPRGFGIKWLRMTRWKIGDALFVKNT